MSILKKKFFLRLKRKEAIYLLTDTKKGNPRKTSAMRRPFTI